MRRLRQIGVLVLLLVSCLAPAMACMLPGAQLTVEERACCRTMQDQCGQMEMPASHGCCHKAPLTVYDRALARNTEVQHLDLVPVLWLTPSEVLTAESFVIRWADHDYSPPQSPPSNISILRI